MGPRLISRSYSALVGLITTWWASVCERIRMRLSAALMDAGAYLALDPIERRARKLKRRLNASKGRRLGPYRSLIALGADELAGEAALVLGRRATSSGQGPSRIHSLLCVAVGEGCTEPEEARPSPGISTGEILKPSPKFYWAVRTQRGDAPLGQAEAGTSMLRECEGALEMALIAFFTDPVTPALAGLDRSSPHEPPGEGLDQGLGQCPGSVPKIEQAADSSAA